LLEKNEEIYWVPDWAGNYNACYMHGWVLRNNQKMSKFLGNFIEPEDLINGTLKEIKNNKKYSNLSYYLKIKMIIND